MNIFIVHENPTIAAHQLCDKHVVKMIVEGCQMLSTIHRIGASHVIYAPVELFKESFANHPCTIWARESVENYNWLAEHTYELSNEYSRRYNKTHKCHDMTVWFENHVPYYIPKSKLTPFAQAMPDKYKCPDAVQAYRNYYIGEKARFAKWKYTEQPLWFSEGLNNVPMQVLQS
jgi:hypothetical protein